jgi:hypothetical protein
MGELGSFLLSNAEQCLEKGVAHKQPCFYLVDWQLISYQNVRFQRELRTGMSAF